MEVVDKAKEATNRVLSLLNILIVLYEVDFGLGCCVKRRKEQRMVEMNVGGESLLKSLLGV